MKRIMAVVIGGLLLSVGFVHAPASKASAFIFPRFNALLPGEVHLLSYLFSLGSEGDPPGEPTWSKTGSCTLTPTRYGTTLTMGSNTCTLTVRFTKSGTHQRKPATVKIYPLLFKVGDQGPAGGTIFFVDNHGMSGTSPVYSEVACAGWFDGECGGRHDFVDPEIPWCDSNDKFFPRNYSMGFTGEKNSNIIAKKCPRSINGSAAQLAVDLVLGGKSDWFLPSLGELQQIRCWAYKKTSCRISRTSELINGDLAYGHYWSSTEVHNDEGKTFAFYVSFRANEVDFDVKRQERTYKRSPLYVRPIRTFKQSEIKR